MTEGQQTWYSTRLEREITVARWGHVGVPVVVFPTAGGDATEIERWHLVDACSDLLASGAVKLYSLDSVNGRAMIEREGDAGRRSYILRQYFEFIRHELVPAIAVDSGGETGELIAVGASIGAFNALGCVAAFPDVFRAAVCMSGTFDLRRFLHGEPTSDFWEASPLHYLATLADGHLDALRKRFVILASGEGANEDIGESWRTAHELGRLGIPNRVDSWGPSWPHDWPLWRAMLPRYLAELVT